MAEQEPLDLSEYVEDTSGTERPARQAQMKDTSITIKGYFSCEYCGQGHSPDSACPPPCEAEPCEVCGACSACQDFHFYGGGCTEERCPLERRLAPHARSLNNPQ